MNELISNEFFSFLFTTLVVTILAIFIYIVMPKFKALVSIFGVPIITVGLSLFVEVLYAGFVDPFLPLALFTLFIYSMFVAGIIVGIIKLLVSLKIMYRRSDDK